VDMIVFGHSHMPFLGKGRRRLVPDHGSPTDTRYAPYNFGRSAHGPVTIWKRRSSALEVFAAA